MRHPLPTLGPGNSLDARAAVWAAHPPRRVSESKFLVADPQIAPLAFGTLAVHPSDLRPAPPAPQQPLGDPFYLRDQLAVHLANLADAVSFETQSLSDKRFHAHRLLASFRRLEEPTKDTRITGALRFVSPSEDRHTFRRRAIKLTLFWIGLVRLAEGWLR